MLPAAVSSSTHITHENELTHRNPSARSTGKTDELSITVETLGVELQQNIANIQNTRTNRASIKYLKKATPTLTLLCDAAASTLSYSAALCVNSSASERSITSGIAWAAAALFSSIEHTLLTSKKMLGAVLADTTSLGAGIGSAASSLLSQHGQTQTLINGVASISNSLLILSGTIRNIAVLRGEYNQTTLPSALSLDRTVKTLTHLAGLADILSGVTGLISTAKTNGSSTHLNALSSNFWMTSSLLNTFAAVLRTQIKRLERSSTSPACEAQLQELKQQVENKIAEIAEKTTLIDKQHAELKALHRVSDIQDAAIAKLQKEALRKRAHIPKRAADDDYLTLPATQKPFRHQRSFSETTPLLSDD
jgi:hypothetical protein